MLGKKSNKEIQVLLVSQWKSLHDFDNLIVKLLIVKILIFFTL